MLVLRKLSAISSRIPIYAMWSLADQNLLSVSESSSLSLIFKMIRNVICSNPVSLRPINATLSPIARRTHWNHEDWPSDLDSESFPSRAIWIQHKTAHRAWSPHGSFHGIFTVRLHLIYYVFSCALKYFVRLCLVSNLGRRCLLAKALFASEIDASTKPKSAYLGDSREDKTLRWVLSRCIYCDLSGKSAPTGKSPKRPFVDLDYSFLPFGSDWRRTYAYNTGWIAHYLLWR